MTFLTFLRDAHDVAAVAMEVSIACFSLIAYRRTRFAFFALLAAGTLLQASLVTAVEIHGNTLEPMFLCIYRMGAMVAIALVTPGVILLIVQFLKLSLRGTTRLTNRSSQPLPDE